MPRMFKPGDKVKVKKVPERGNLMKKGSNEERATVISYARGDFVNIRWDKEGPKWSFTNSGLYYAVNFEHVMDLLDLSRPVCLRRDGSPVIPHRVRLVKPFGNIPIGALATVYEPRDDLSISFLYVTWDDRSFSSGGYRLERFEPLQRLKDVALPVATADGRRVTNLSQRDEDDRPFEADVEYLPGKVIRLSFDVNGQFYPGRASDLDLVNP